MMKIRLFGFACLLLLSISGYSQQKPLPIRILNKMFNDTISTGKPKFLAYPTLGFAPETSWEIGVSSVFVFNAKNDTSNRLSEVSGFTFFTLAQQYGVNFEHAIYTHEDKWFFLGKLKAQSYPLLYYGIGPDIEGEELGIANANFNLIRERFLRKIHGHWYVGLELNYERLGNVQFDWIDSTQTHVLPSGSNGSNNLGLGLGLVYDTRHNVLNVRHGMLSEIGYLLYEPSLGSTNKLGTLFLDSRAYFKTSKRNVIATQVLGQFSNGDVPFNQLSMIGGEVMMRGYYLGKYRDKNMISAQVEHRWLPFKFSKRIGGALFAGVGSVAPDLKFRKVLWTVGGGLRVLIFPQRDIFSRVDVGLNPDGYGLYILIGEAF